MTALNGFQTGVNTQPAPGVEGDFCSTNPRASALAGPGAFVAGPLGIIVGRFAWASYDEVDPNGAPAIVNNYGTGVPTGFIHLEQQGLITDYLAIASMKVPAGFGVTVMASGDFWAKNNGATQALRGQKAYANFADGKVTFAATGAPTAGGSATGTIGAATNGFTGSINDNVLMITAVASGAIHIGTTVSGAGVASGTKIVGQLSGTPNDIGEYAVNIPEQEVDSEAMTGTYGLFTAVSGLTGAFGLGDVLSGAGGGGVTAGTTITEFISATGGLGTYAVDPTQGVTSTAISVSAINVETPWIAQSSGLPGSLIKMSRLSQ